MNKFLQKIYNRLGDNIVKNINVETLKTKVMNGKQKDIRELKKTNGVIKIMIEKGEIELRIVKK